MYGFLWLGVLVDMLTGVMFGTAYFRASSLEHWEYLWQELERSVLITCVGSYPVQYLLSTSSDIICRDWRRDDFGSFDISDVRMVVWNETSIRESEAYEFGVSVAARELPDTVRPQRQDDRPNEALFLNRATHA
eukprot:4475455-Amphidinium_carterae.1